MYRNNYSPNSHGPVPPFTPGGGQFRSPGPRFFQQAVPHHGGPGGPSPRRTPPSHKGPSPRGHYDRSFTPRGQGYNQRTPTYNSGGSHRGRGYPRHSSPYTPSGRGRGSYSGNHRHDCNPGGSADISLYYKPSMTSDPWNNTQPVSSSQSPQSSSLSGDTDQSNTESS